MANVIKTVVTYNLNGSTRDFNIPFEYLARKFVQVTLLGKDRKVLTLNTDYRFSTKTTITTTQTWGNAQGYSQIEIRRYTSATERLVDFTDGSILRAYDLNIAQIQTMHVAEEARDLTADTIGVNNEGHLDARGRRIVNLGNAVNDRDAVPFGQLKTMNQNAWDAQNKAQQFRNEAQTFRNQAEGFKNEANTFKTQAAASQSAAKTSETNAKNSENDANASKDAAATSASAAKTSETNAKNSENSAKSQADLAKKWATNPRNQKVDGNEYSSKHYSEVAKEEANKLSNWNALAGAVESVSGTDVRWKGSIESASVIQADGSMQIVERASVGPGLSQDMTYVMNLWRSSNRATGNVEDWVQYGTKRNDMYLYTWNDPAEWPEGRSNGNGVHHFYGDVRVHHDLVMEGEGKVKAGKHDGIRLQSTASASSYISSWNDSKRSWWIGRGAGNSENVSWSSDTHSTNISLTAVGVTTNKPLEVNGNINVNSRALILKANARRHLMFNDGSKPDGYLFKDPGAGAWSMNFGEAASMEFTFEANGRFSCPTKAWAIAADGNLKGTKWGGGWLDAWVNNNFIKKTKNWTRVWAGTATGNAQTGTLPQDLRFRNVWLVMGDSYRNFIRFGPDGYYFLQSYGGWIKLQLHSSGKILKNIQDSNSVLREIWVENA